MNNTLFHIHDPMCSWCWGFKPTLEELLESLPATVTVKNILGGLAPDSDAPMPEATRQMLQQTWRAIQTSIPGTEFNFDFWTKNQPKRSTWPSCRAVLAAAQQNPELEVPMITAIQKAYYLNAQNPSETATLIELAESIGCDATQFADYLHSAAAHAELETHRHAAHQLGAQGFPSLVFVNSRSEAQPIAIDYNNSSSMLEQIERANVG
ncbi:DsbA family protein [Granulosicoccus antarcticus]|uniref:DSBA-like thioredoxin domain-containing protein n=1 Tax=Granulosicoccus antarcticus IMCC3135 TaxID=1192854 RepID=A0A2Z2NYH9_9GAMM|nr:DsbA family protein [Granulosicoccus antarcticus]ASJ76492.1 hypothetical protein IMCC3135_32235 [Granulosicoccus antarcticus IMCC3135]